jgi:AcrR family transcriptional regulator
MNQAPNAPPTDLAIRDDGQAETRILEAARRVFTRHGTSGARMQQVAAEAGVNQALIHYYFRSKQQLAERVFLEAVGRMSRGFAPALATETSLERLIERFVEGYIDTMRHTPFLPAYVLSETFHHPGRLETLMQRAMDTVPAEVGRRALAQVTRLLDDAVARGACREMTPRQLLVNGLALVVFPFASRSVLMPLLDMDEPAFAAFLDERRAELPGFILTAIRP